MKILLSGSTGFLGNVILKFISKDHDIQTIGRGNSCTYKRDLTQVFDLSDSFDCIIHIAGKAHIEPRSQEEEQAFWDVNVIGTLNLLKALRTKPSMRFVFISSVAVYGKSYGICLSEETPLFAIDPYGKSKIQAEVEVSEWCHRQGVICTILRLPLVYAENPPGNLKSMINAIRMGFYFNISGGLARKSMVLASDVAKFVLKASEVGGTYNLTDGYHPNFNELSHCIAKQFNRNFVPNIPIFFAKILAFMGDVVGQNFPINSKKLNKITSTLIFDDSKARIAFGWDPTPVLKSFKIDK